MLVIFELVRGKMQKAGFRQKDPPCCDCFCDCGFNKDALKARVSRVKRRATVFLLPCSAQSGHVIGQGTYLAVVEFGGNLTHLQVVQAHTITKIGQLRRDILGMLA